MALTPPRCRHDRRRRNCYREQATCSATTRDSEGGDRTEIRAEMWSVGHFLPRIVDRVRGFAVQLPGVGGAVRRWRRPCGFARCASHR